jgi:hypothetical protein
MDQPKHSAIKFALFANVTGGRTCAVAGRSIDRRAARHAPILQQAFLYRK